MSRSDFIWGLKVGSLIGLIWGLGYAIGALR